MKRKILNYQFSQSLFLISLLISFILGLASVALANGSVTETSVNNVVLIAVICLGGLISLLGAIMVFRGIGGKSDVDLALSEKKKISFKKVSQGVVVIIVGALILIGALYLGQQKRTITGKTVDLNHGKVKY
jgi:O-antigen/teichoic acid export membrane protein